MPKNKILEQALTDQNKAVVADDVNGEGSLSLSNTQSWCQVTAGRITT